MTGPTNWKPRFLMAFKIVSNRDRFCWRRLAIAHYDALVDHGFAVRPTSRQNRRVGNAHRPLRPRDRCVG